MKKIIYGIAACLAIVAAGCATKGKTVSSANLSGEWKIAQLKDSVLPSQPAEPLTITFETSDSTFSAQTGCNIIGGKFVVGENSFKFDNMFSTRMMCPDMYVEETLSQLLPDVTSCETGTNGELVFFNADKKQLITLKK